MLPSTHSDQDLANAFSNFFVTKIENIRRSFPPVSATLLQTQPHKDPHCRLSVFEPTCVTEIKEFIMKSPSKSCELDPVPTSLMKQNIYVFAKYITIIVSISLSCGCFPDSQKIAHVKPLLKKPNLDKEVFKNYRPVANLKYLGKTIERVFSSRISDHVCANNLSDTFQSAYKPFHGTETALLRVNNDILSAMHDGKITADSCITMLDKCFQEIRSWMRRNFLKLNDKKQSLFYLDRVSNYQRFLFHLLQYW